MNWWTNKTWPAIGESYPGLDWPLGAMFMDALKGDGGAVLQQSFEGSLQLEADDLVKELEEIGGRVIFRDSGEIWYVAWDRGFVRIGISDDDAGLRVITDDQDLLDKVTVIANKYIGPKISCGKVYVLIQTQEGPKLKSVGTAAADFERGNYEAGVVNDFDHVISDLKTNDPCGRLVILDGPPGTGKTFLVRALLSEVPEALFVMVPAHLVPSLADPSMISALVDIKKNKGEAPLIFVVEDADQCLSPRAADNVHAVSSLLNLGDGILGAALDIRLICTTNAKGEELDQAVLRPGRLCRRINVESLSADTATSVYNRLTGKNRRLSRGLVLAEVYRLARDEGWVPATKKSLGFGSDKPGSVFDGFSPIDSD